MVAPAVGPWQQLNELGGVKPLAFDQYGELGPGLEELLDAIAEAVPAKQLSGTSSTTISRPRASNCGLCTAAGGDGHPKSAGADQAHVLINRPPTARCLAGAGREGGGLAGNALGDLITCKGQKKNISLDTFPIAFHSAK
jgi:hypothetical protein